MKGRMVTLAAAIAMAAASAWAHAQQQMPKPSPEMSKLDFFEGTWSCEGTMQPGPGAPAAKMTSTVEIEDDLGGFWQAGTVRGTMANMPPFEGRLNVTYDPGAKQFMMLWVDNMGGWAQATASGWQGDKFVYQGETHMPGQKPMQSRDTFGRAGAGTMTHTSEIQMDGKWTRVGEETCRKK